MIRRVKIGKLERGLILRRGEPARYLRPGIHWVLGFGWTVRKHAVTDTFLDARSDLEVEQVSGNPETWNDLAFVHPREHERALVWIDGRLAWVLDRGPWAFWRVARDVRVEVVDTRSAPLVRTRDVEAALAAEGASQALEPLVVPPGMVGYLVVDGVARDELAPGRHALWRGGARSRFELVPRGPHVLEVETGDVFSRDGAELSVEVAVTCRVTAERRWAESGGGALERLRLATRAATRAAFGRRPLGRTLGDREVAALALESALAAGARSQDVQVLAVSLGEVVVVRRLARRRFRGFGDRGREVAEALRGFTARPYYRARHEAGRR